MNLNEKEEIMSKIKNFRNEEINYYKNQLAEQKELEELKSSDQRQLSLEESTKIKQLEDEFDQEGEFYVFKPAINKKHQHRKMYFYIGKNYGMIFTKITSNQGKISSNQAVKNEFTHVWHPELGENTYDKSKWPIEEIKNLSLFDIEGNYIMYHIFVICPYSHYAPLKHILKLH
jgi:hypothetical protein